MKTFKLKTFVIFVTIMIHEKSNYVKNESPGMSPGFRLIFIILLLLQAVRYPEKVKNKRNAPEKDIPFGTFVVF